MLNKEFPKPQAGGAPDRERGVFLFENFRLDAGERVLLRDGEPVALTPRAFDTLLVLVAHGGRLVEKDRLLEEVWGGTYVEEKTLAQNVLTIRKALGTTPGGAPYIETVPKHGYRLAAGVRVARREEAPPAGADFAGATRTRTEVIVEEEFETDDDEPRAAPLAPLAAQINPDPRTDGVVEPSTSRPASKRGARAAAAAAVFAAACVLLAAAAFVWRGAPAARVPFERFEITKLTTSGDVGSVSISPDGKYAAYTSHDAGRARLLVRQVDGSGSVEVVPPAEVGYIGVTFAPDGASLYYVTREKGSALGVLYRAPVLGGAPKKLIEDVDSPVAFSPDGRQLAFVRVSGDQKETALVVADAAGGTERTLASRRVAEGFSLSGAAWSPDGRLIACSSNADPTAKWAARLLIADARDGTVRPFSSDRWSWIGRAAWAADGGGLILVAWDNESPAMSDQLWFVPYPSGAPRRITNDVSGYQGVGVSADARAIVSARSERVASFWIAPLAEARSASKLGGVSTDRFSERHGMAWAPDGRVVYASSASGEPNVWVMNGDGSNRRQLTSERGGNFEPAVSPDGRLIAYVSYATGERHVWLMNSDGSAPRQLTSGEGDDAPTFTPDGAWVIYSAYAGGHPALWKIPAAGGAATRISDLVADLPAVSPDGKLVACYRFPDLLSRPRLAIVSLADGKLAREFQTPNPLTRSGVRWTPDGGSLAFVATRAGVSNVWLQPADGSPAHPLTDFTSDRLFRFDISRDGRIVYERGVSVNDAILIREK